MDHSKALAALLLAAALAGCQTGRTAAGHAQRMLRPPGERLEALPERVGAQYGCSARAARPFFKLERHEVVPDRVGAGGLLNHRLVYALCPTGPTEVVRGALETRIVHEGRTLVRDRIARYELKPGRWIVDATVEIPEAADAGVYAIELRFESKSVRFRDERTFAVSRR